MSTVIATIVATIGVIQMLHWIGPRITARRFTRLVPSPGTRRVFTLRLTPTSGRNRVFAVWSREGERLGTIWRHHPGMWLADDGDERVVGSFDNRPEAALHLYLLDLARRALREQEHELRDLGEHEAE